MEAIQPVYSELWLEPFDVASLTARFICTNPRALSSASGSDLVEVDIEPPLMPFWSALDMRPAHVSPEHWPLLTRTHARVVLGPRHAGTRLLPGLSEAQVHVYVFVRAGNGPQVDISDLAKPIWGIVSLPRSA